MFGLRYNIKRTELNHAQHGSMKMDVGFVENRTELLRYVNNYGKTWQHDCPAVLLSDNLTKSYDTWKTEHEREQAEYQRKKERSQDGVTKHLMAAGGKALFLNPFALANLIKAGFAAIEGALVEEPSPAPPEFAVLNRCYKEEFTGNKFDGLKTVAFLNRTPNRPLFN